MTLWRKDFSYIFDDNISYVDIVLLPFIRQFRVADIEWFQSLPYENLKEWLSNFLDSLLLNDVMKKYDLKKSKSIKINHLKLVLLLHQAREKGFR